MKKEIKEKIKDFILNVKLALIWVLVIATMISGIIGEMWPKTKFNWPLAICAICGTLLVIMVKIL